MTVRQLLKYVEAQQAKHDAIWSNEQAGLDIRLRHLHMSNAYSDIILDIARGLFGPVTNDETDRWVCDNLPEPSGDEAAELLA